MIQHALPFLCSFNQNIQVRSKEVSFHRPQLVPALLLPNDMAENFPGFPLLCFLSIRSCSFSVIQLLSWCIGPLCHWDGRFFFLSGNVLKNLTNCCCHFIMKKPELDLVDSNSVPNHTSDYQTRTNAQRESHLSIMTMILDRIRRNEVLSPNNHNYYNFFLFSLFYITF